MKPVIVLLGRPNVGKSTLFNRLTRSRDALVADVPGLTRDRKYGDGKLGGRDYFVVDTGGIADGGALERAGSVTADATHGIDVLMSRQTLLALDEADVIFFLVDGREGPSAVDQEVANLLRRRELPVWVVVNKTEGLDRDTAVADFFALGLGTPVAISAAHGDGVAELVATALASFPEMPAAPTDSGEATVPKIAVVGRPNAGKSTLVNAFLGESRTLVSDQPGTTRDSIAIPLERQGRQYVLIDTAGVRRRARVAETVEKFSVIKTLQSIDEANVVVLVLDAERGVSDQDASLAGYIMEQGRAVVIAVNKEDVLNRDARTRLKHEIDRRLPFLAFAERHFISALRGRGLQAVYRSIDRAFAAATRSLRTAELNRVLQAAVERVPPPMGRGHRIKLKYAHLGGKNPPLIVVHGNQVAQLPASYRRYLENVIRDAFDLVGTPVRIELQQGENPYKSAAKATRRRAGGAKRRPQRH